MPIQPKSVKPVVRDVIPAGSPLTEAEVAKGMRAVMGPAGLTKQDSVLPEGVEPAPAPRGREREEQRAARAAVAHTASIARTRPRDVLQRVREGAKRMSKTANVAGALEVLKAASPRDRQYLLLAEKHLGRAREGVLKPYRSAIIKTVEKAFLQAMAKDEKSQPKETAKAAKEGE